MWGSGSQPPLDFGSQSQGGLYGFSQESGGGFGFNQSQSQQSPFDLSQTPYSQSQSKLSQPSIPECTECHSTEMHTTDDGDMVRVEERARGATSPILYCTLGSPWRGFARGSRCCRTTELL